MKMHVSSSPSSDSSTTPPTLSSGPVVQDELVSSTTTADASGAHSSTTKISFSVARRDASHVVVTSKSNLDNKFKEADEEEDEEEEQQQQRAKKRGILSLEDGIIVDSEAQRSQPKKVFVIPVLRLSSQAQIERLKKAVEEGTATEADHARLSLLLESVEGVQQQEKLALYDSDLQTGPTVAVPDDAAPDYESMPVGEFGLAFLRGCGWRDAQSCIGKSNAQAVPMRVTAPRPKGLGLGAVLPSTTAPPTASSAKKSDAQQEANGEEKLGKHSYVKCLAGLNKGAYGQVSSMDEENASVFVELVWPSGSVGKTVRVSQMAVEVVPRKEFPERLKAAARGADTAATGGRSSENGRRRERIRV